MIDQSYNVFKFQLIRLINRQLVVCGTGTHTGAISSGVPFLLIHSMRALKESVCDWKTVVANCFSFAFGCCTLGLSLQNMTYLSLLMSLGNKMLQDSSSLKQILKHFGIIHQDIGYGRWHNVVTGEQRWPQDSLRGFRWSRLTVWVGKVRMSKLAERWFLRLCFWGVRWVGWSLWGMDGVLLLKGIAARSVAEIGRRRDADGSAVGNCIVTVHIWNLHGTDE